MSEAQEPTLDQEFLSSLIDIKILLDKEKEHRNAIFTKGKKNNEMSLTALTDLVANYKPITRSIVSFAQNLSSNKDVKEVFGQLVEKPIEAFKSIGATPATVDLFLRYLLSDMDFLIY